MKALNILLVVVLFSFLSSSNAEEKEARPSSDTKPESLRQALIQAGYEADDFGRIDSFKDFVQFGSASAAQKSITGDAFDKIEIKKETAKHRDALGKRKFVLDKLALSIVDIKNVETKGILAEVRLPFRISHGIKFQSLGASGVLEGRPHPLDAETSYSFLTKDDQLQRCVNFQQVNEVRNRNGVLYRAESNISVLVLVIKDDINVLKQIARNPKDYSVSIELTGLNYARPETWGFYKEEALIEEDWDCEMLRDFWPPVMEIKQPNYFATKVRKSDGTDNIPEIARATISSLLVFDDKKDEIIGGYNVKDLKLKQIEFVKLKQEERAKAEQMESEKAKAKQMELVKAKQMESEKEKEKQMELAKAKQEGEVKFAIITKELVLIPAGKFMMGSPASEQGRRENEKQYEVTITKPFYIGKYEVTQEQYETVMEKNPSEIKGAKLPVTNVSWEDCQDFIKKLNEKTTGGYKLPTEAEWEFACRAGATTAYAFGDKITPKDANYEDSKIGKLVAVGSYKPNEFGLYDMHGNVYEWCEAWHDDYPNGAVIDPKGPTTGYSRVLRGGSFSNSDLAARSSCRSGSSPTDRSDLSGFRLARTK